MPDNGGNEVVGQRPGKGSKACATACAAFEALRLAGIPTHFEARLADDSIMVRKTEPIRIEFISRNLAFGSYLRRHPGVAPLADIAGTREITLKDDAKDDPILTREEVVSSGLLGAAELSVAMELLGRVTDALTGFFKSKNLRLADLKMEVGRVSASGASSAGVSDAGRFPAPTLIVIDDPGYDNIRVFSGDHLMDIDELHAALMD